MDKIQMKNMKKIILACFCALCVNVPAETKFQDLSSPYVGKWELPADLEPNATLNYYLGTKGVKPATGWPLYIYLHGSGPREHEWSTGLKLAQIFDDAPALYWIPQIPQEGNWYRWYQRSKQWAYEKLLKELLATGEVDPNRIYVFGISEGGYGSQRLASFYGDYWAAAGPMAGGEPLKNAPVENCGNIGFSLLTGAMDKGFYRDELTYWTQQAFDRKALENPGLYAHRVNLIPNHGHHIDYRLTTPWLAHFTRNPQPTKWEWEDFEMDGRHREGFYYLQVLKRPSEKRQMYRVNVENNVVDVTVEDVDYTCTQTDSIWGIEMQFTRQFTPATNGKLRVFLSDKLVNLKKKVTLKINGKEVFCGKVKREEKWENVSRELYFDPERMFEYAVEGEY